jgi:ribosomal protein S8
MKNYLYNIIANIKTGQLNRRTFIFNRKKNFCESFLNILWDEGYILGYKIELKNSNRIKIFLKYKNSKPTINSIKFLSTSSRRLYYSVKEIWKLDSSKSCIIFSTTKGLKSIIECKKLKIGGEPFIIIN